MYSNMASRQWFIGVKSNTDKQENRLRAPTDFNGRRAKSAPAVDRINLCENLCRSRAAVRRVAAPCNLRANKIVRISRADNIRPCNIVLICNIIALANQQHLQ